MNARLAKFATMPISEFAEVRIKALTNAHAKVRLRSYVKLFVAWCGYDPKLEEIDAELTTAWEQHSLNSLKLAVATSADRRQAIEALVRWWNPQAIPKRRKLYEPADDTTLAGVILGAYMLQNTRIASPSTRRHYHILCKQLDEMLGRPAMLGDLSDEVASQFISWLKSRPRKLSVETINQKMNYLRAAWRWLHAKGMVDTSPTIGLLKTAEPLPQAWTLEQFRQLVEHAKQEPGNIGTVPAGLYWESLLVFIFYYGERIGALLAAKVSDYDRATSTLTINGSDRKGGVKAAVYDLLPVVKELLERLIAADPKRELLWPWPGAKDLIHYRFGKLVRKSGLPFIKGKSGFHKIRRTCASYVELNGGDATQHLGHSRRSVTVKSYLDIRIAKRRNYAELLPNPLEETKADQ